MPSNKREIWKFPIAGHENFVAVPREHQFLTAQIQHGQLCVWVAVAKDTLLVHVPVRVIGTGWSEDLTGWRYLATAQDGALVWHVFIPQDEAAI